MYKVMTVNSLLNFIDEKDIVRLSPYTSGQKLEYGFEEYIYNDTAKDITLAIMDNSFGMESVSTVTIEAGRIYAFSWMIDSIVVQ